MPIREWSKDELQDLWESGIPLDDAWVEFAHFFDRYALTALRTHPANDPDVLGLDNPRYQELNKGWLPRTWEARQKKLAMTTESERGILVDEIYAGRLWATGFRTLLSGFDEPVRVPRQLFLTSEGSKLQMPVNIDWGRAELTDGVVRYFDIRVLRSPVATNESPEVHLRSTLAVAEPSLVSAPALEVSASEDPKPAQAPPGSGARGGKPNKSNQIRRKVEELWRDPLFRAIPNRTHQARKVRAHLCGENTRHLDEMQGYRTTQIKRLIGEVASKPTKI
jgi:hypothetical protein